jgi:NAD(P)-dependent dehydrogenase (short-subunit alcohol dehydrogenase family)
VSRGLRSLAARASSSLGGRALAVEMAPTRVNAVSPGWVDTPIWDALVGSQKAELLEEMARRLPAGRIATPDDIAPAYIFLMENEFATGTTLHVDGGQALV